jgi:hypothetical protein
MQPWFTKRSGAWPRKEAKMEDKNKQVSENKKEIETPRDCTIPSHNEMTDIYANLSTEDKLRIDRQRTSHISDEILQIRPSAA